MAFWPTCALYLAFVPQPDITAYELAYICAHNGCNKGPICFTQEKYDELEPKFKRHFKQEN
jgi:hypothetical protein